jgi:hypoxanthine phosphoribosyltransferase
MDLPKFEDFETLYSAGRIQERVSELGAEISRDLADSQNLVLACVLKGALVFMADIMRHLPSNVTCDFLRLSSYEGIESTGRVRFDFDLTQPIKGKDVLVVEDIVDTGRSMSFLLKSLKAREPRSLKICTLLDKPARRVAEVPIAYTGFTIPDQFVIGYGLDLEGRYRNLPYIAALKPEIQARFDGDSEDALD